MDHAGIAHHKIRTQSAVGLAFQFRFDGCFRIESGLDAKAWNHIPEIVLKAAQTLPVPGTVNRGDLFIGRQDAGDPQQSDRCSTAAAAGAQQSSCAEKPQQQQAPSDQWCPEMLVSHSSRQVFPSTIRR